jgi:2'-5' RNA ligase
VKWSPIYNLHITTKFIGEWPIQDIEKLENALRGVPKRPAIPVDVKGLGWYPNPHHPRVFWAGVQGGAELESLARDLDTALDPLGIVREDREFAPHLTLARIKRPVPLQTLLQAVADLDSVDFGSFEARRFDLYRSQPGPAGSVYTKISEYPFTAE